MDLQVGTVSKFSISNAGAVALLTINGNTFTTGTGTLTIAASKVLTVSNTLTFTGTDSSSVAFGTGGTVLFNGGALGTPASGTLTSCTGLPVGGITATGTPGATTFLRGDSTWSIPPGVTLTAPVTKTADFTVGAAEQWLINNKAAATCTVTLPAAASFVGREITFSNLQAFTVVSVASNVAPIGSATPGTAILPAVIGAWATLLSDGTNWNTMQQSTIIDGGSF
jgi:hypothetical protein